ncbi:MAG: arginyltransferase [Robiginitomaculum sp.]
MTRHFDPKSLQFYITLPSPCPYLPGEMERKIFTPLDPIDGPKLNDYLTHSGFRRSQNVIYRPACETCNACQSLRVKVQKFSPRKSMKRISTKNQGISREVVENLATQEQFDLLYAYLHSRHPKGGMTEMNFDRYEKMVEDCAARTEIFEYRDTKGRLIACCITDSLHDGLSMVYSFFDTEQPKRSLGNYMILDHITVCKRAGLPYLYLGYWVKNSAKMCYKSRYKPYQTLGVNGWIDN